jgi:hypothetical protein
MMMYSMFMTIIFWLAASLLFVFPCGTVAQRAKIQLPTTVSVIANSIQLPSIQQKYNDFSGWGRRPSAFTVPGMKIEFDREYQKHFSDSLYALQIKDTVLQGHTQVFHQAQSEAKTWQEAHRATTTYLDFVQQQRKEYVDIPQFIASPTLLIYILDLPLTREVQEAIEYYIVLLQQYENYNDAVSYCASLLKLRGYWSEEKIQQIAQSFMKSERIWNRQPHIQREITIPLMTEALAKGNRQEGVDTEWYRQFRDTPDSVAAKQVLQRFRSYLKNYPNETLPINEKLAWKYYKPFGMGSPEARLLLLLLAEDEEWKK